MTRPGLDGAFADWKEREALAEAMIPLIGGVEELSNQKEIVKAVFEEELEKAAATELGRVGIEQFAETSAGMYRYAIARSWHGREIENHQQRAPVTVAQIADHRIPRYRVRVPSRLSCQH